MKNCTFCEFVAQRSKIDQTIFEDDNFLVILDDFPLAKGHTLVILKEHKPDICSVKPKILGLMGRLVARISKAIQLAVKAERIYVVSLGEAVPHVHFHLIPRCSKDVKGFSHFMSSRGKLSKREGKNLSKRIRAKLEEVQKIGL